MAECITARLRDIDLSDIEEEADKTATDDSGPAFEYTVANVVSGARFADFSLDRFIAVTGAEPGIGFPAAALRTQGRGVFSVFRTGSIVHTGLANEADSHRAIEDLARELKYSLAEPPHTHSTAYDVPTRCPTNLSNLVRLTHGHRERDGTVSFRLRVGDQGVHVIVNAAGSMRIGGMRSIAELRKAADLARNCVRVCIALDNLESEAEEEEEEDDSECEAACEE